MEALGSGTPFNEVVIRYSEAPSRFKDGIIGPFKRGDLAIVPARDWWAVVTVEASDPPLDPRAKFEYKTVAAKFDPAEPTP